MKMGDPKELVALLARHERAVSRLYAIYAGKFPAYSALFAELADQEEGHAELLEQLATLVEEGELCCLAARFKPMAVKTALHYVERQIEQARVDSFLPARQALSVARDLANSLIEAKWFEVLGDEPPQLRGALDQLARETAEHRHRVQQAWLVETSAG